MNLEAIREHKFQNRIQTVLLLAAMAGLLALMGWSLAGLFGLILVAALAIGLLAFSPNLSADWVMRMSGAQPLSSYQLGEVRQILYHLAAKAGLPRVPKLYYLPSSQLNAFATGSSDHSGVALSHGLLRHLNRRELQGVLAHEISHIQNRDTRLLGLSQMVGKMTGSLSLFGQLLLLVNLPLFLMGSQVVPWTLILLFLVAPTLSDLLQLALSRTREFDADLGAVRLTGDALGLASALNKLSRFETGFWQRLLSPARDPGPSWLRTHPKTEERVKRLLAMAPNTVRHRPTRSAMPLGYPSQRRSAGFPMNWF